MAKYLSMVYKKMFKKTEKPTKETRDINLNVNGELQWKIKVLIS